MRESRSNEPTVVLGGTGKIGRRVVRLLRERGVPVRVASRSGERRFDWTDRTTWEPALRGARSVYLVYLPDLASPDAAPRLREVGELAVSQGAERLVFQSGGGWPEAVPAEEAVRKAGAAWTVLRPAWFAQNFSEDLFLEPLRRGEVRLSAGDGGEPFVDARDVAEMAVAALTEDVHAGRVYELSGPESLSFGDAVARIARASGRDIRYVSLTPERFESELVRTGVPAEFVALELGRFAAVRSGAYAEVSDGVRRVLGREPRSFAEYVRETAATGVWANAG
ncbi:NAD(P)H-binding protein [Streptomyces litchfieldiae]|uniref:NAD(P)H-binding protein n=1 Tax=Streptomyces litchfieldiae TaxID=3075543 RepID=A0ABU2MQY2_9ACTN|nr:NAD(P)H-binding protein [Streptomyces sp. DSM 44938]MDT0343945.1 NAD(P)H-binding protein [Streptomyces sp. DSM 44938]